VALDQAAQIKKSLDWYRSAGGEAADIEHWMDAQIKRVGLATRIPDAEFLHTILYVEPIHDALQKSVLVFADDRWRADFTAFRFILDQRFRASLQQERSFSAMGLCPCSAAIRGSAFSD